MLAIGIRYLNGFVVASAPDAREQVEWPPHPGRVFMALAAAHFETGADPAEREALQWLQRLGTAPVLSVPETMPGAVVEEHFVPINDRPIWKKNPAKPKQKPPPPLQSTPGLMRDRQARTFARAFIGYDAIYLIWPDTDPPESIRCALEGAFSKVTRIGHSSSLVQVWLASPGEIGSPSWVPDDDRAEIYLRVASPGTLEDLERCYDRVAVEAWVALEIAARDDSDVRRQKAARENLRKTFPDGPPARLRPVLPLSQGYARPAPAPSAAAGPGGAFSADLVVLTLEPEESRYRHLDLLCVPQVVMRWREAILAHSNDLSARARELLSGHGPDGERLEAPHLAFVPLAFVGHERADGHLLGVALALPYGISRDDRREMLRAAGRVERLLLGRLGAWRISRVASARPAWNLRPEVWTAHPHGATHWSTVTPIAFDRHPKIEDRAAYQKQVASMIADGCAHIGLPRPREVVVTPVSAHLGVPPSSAFQRSQRKDGSKRRHAHAILIFDEAVRGPILLGAGRYRGYGACRPLSGRGETPL